MIGLYLLLAQTTTTVSGDWWDSAAGQTAGNILSIFVAIGAVAGGVAGMRALYKAYHDGGIAFGERIRKKRVLDQVLTSEGWPNGADNIVEAHRDIYDRVAGVDERVAGIETTLQDMQRQLETLLTDR